jgi:hypothetical protein
LDQTSFTGAIVKDILLSYKLEPSVAVWLGVAALTDVIIAGALFWHFVRMNVDKLLSL